MNFPEDISTNGKPYFIVNLNTHHVPHGTNELMRINIYIKHSHSYHVIWNETYTHNLGSDGGSGDGGGPQCMRQICTDTPTHSPFSLRPIRSINALKFDCNCQKSENIFALGINTIFP